MKLRSYILLVTWYNLTFLNQVAPQVDTFYNVYHLHYQESETLKKDLSKCSYLASCGHYFVQKLNIQRSIFLPDSHHMGHMSSNNFLLRRTFSELPRGMGDCIWMTEQMNRLTGTVPLKRRNRLTTNFCNKVTFTKVLTDPDKIYNVAKKVFKVLLKRTFLDLLSLT